jgi:hypothetical protein
LNKYQEYDTVWVKDFLTPAFQYMGPVFDGWDAFYQNETEEDMLLAYQYFKLDKNTIFVYQKYPDSIFSGLVKIGGLIALLRIGSLLSIYNKRYFDKDLRDQENSLESNKS